MRRSERRASPQPAPRHQRGLALLTLLLAVALLSMSAGAALLVERLERDRERQRALLFVGAQFTQAIRSYVQAPGVPVRELPSRLEDLVEDRRGPRPVRHLRRVWVDPVTGGSTWGLLMHRGRIAGVHSLSTAAPIVRVDFPPEFERFTGARALTDWRFTVLEGPLAIDLPEPAPNNNDKPAPGAAPPIGGAPTPTDPRIKKATP